MVEYEDEFKEFLPANGVPRAFRNYLFWIKRSAERLGRSIGPADLSSTADAQTLLAEVCATDQRTLGRRLVKTVRDERNLQSTFRKYAQMVQSNFRGLFLSVPAAPAPVATDARLDELPTRVRSEIYRVVRDTSVTREIKRLYQFCCQICETRLEVEPGEFYAEAHHLQPLGQPHNGPDKKENIVCVCPNCHALLDYRALWIGRGTLKLQKHPVSKEFIDYNNRHCR